MRTTHLLMILGALALACQPVESGASLSDPTSSNPGGTSYSLWLELADLGPDLAAVDLHYARPADQPGPRVAELHLTLSEDLSLERAEALEAAEVAGKQLVVQETPGGLRLVLFAADNLTRLDSGPMARLQLRRVSGDSAAVSFTDKQPVFAPPEANAGLILGPALAIEGG